VVIGEAAAWLRAPATDSSFTVAPPLVVPAVMPAVAPPPALGASVPTARLSAST
jgi:hypothetical protein